MSDDQQILFDRADHANLGREWEQELEAVHDWYRLQRRADIVKNPHDWVFITEKRYRAIVGKYSPEHFARTDGGHRLLRSQSDIDFSGGGNVGGTVVGGVRMGGRGFAVCFDAKASKGKSLPLSNIKPHQVHRLRESSRCGTIAGFMIKMSDVDRVFFIRVEFMERRFTDWQKQAGRRAKTGTASISLEDLEMFGTEIKKNPMNMLWDYLEKII